MKYRKKPIEVDAIQFTNENKDQVFNFITCNKYPTFDKDNNPTIKIQTLEGDITASFGDWIIKGVANEFYPCRNDIFKKTYDLAESNLEKETIKIPNIKNHICPNNDGDCQCNCYKQCIEDFKKLNS